MNLGLGPLADQRAGRRQRHRTQHGDADRRQAGDLPTQAQAFAPIPWPGLPVPLPFPIFPPEFEGPTRPPMYGPGLPPPGTNPDGRGVQACDQPSGCLAVCDGWCSLTGQLCVGSFRYPDPFNPGGACAIGCNCAHHDEALTDAPGIPGRW